MPDTAYDTILSKKFPEILLIDQSAETFPKIWPPDWHLIRTNYWHLSWKVTLGHFNYFGVPTNGRALSQFRDTVVRHWFKTLKRRSQRSRITWKKMYTLSATYIPTARVTHPYPLERLRVNTW